MVAKSENPGWTVQRKFLNNNNNNKNSSHVCACAKGGGCQVVARVFWIVACWKPKSQPS